MRCKKCGTDLVDNAQFCHVCGTSVSDPDPCQDTDELIVDRNKDGEHIGDTTELPVVEAKESLLSAFTKQMKAKLRSYRQNKELKKQAEAVKTPEEKALHKRKRLIAAVAVLGGCLLVSLAILGALSLINRGKTPLTTKYFPDKAFLDYVAQFDINKDHHLSEEELAAVTEMDCSQRAITNLAGIELFSNLSSLNCSQNKIVTLDPSLFPQVTSLNSSSNPLTTLDVSSLQGLTSLSCNNDQLGSLILGSLPALTELDCSQNALTTLDLSKLPELISLNCSDNQLNALDVTHNAKLATLNCKNNAITHLDLTENKQLKDAQYDESVALALALSADNFPDQVLMQAIAQHDDGDGKLTQEERDQITQLSLDSSELTSLKGLHYLTHLENLEIKGAHLSADSIELPESLTSLTLTSSNLASLDLSGLHKLKSATLTGNGMTSLTVGAANTALKELNVKENQLKTLDLSSLKGGLSKLYLDPSVKVTGATVNTSSDFSDSELRSLLFSKKYNPNEDDMLTSSERSEVTTLDVNGKPISSLEGLDAFKNLTTLDCGNTKITSLELKGLDKLTELRCAHAQLTQLTLSGLPALTKLDCSQNKLKTLDVSSNKSLTLLNAMGNSLDKVVIAQDSPLSTSNFTLFVNAGTKVEKKS